jgi:hypothetical protein
MASIISFEGQGYTDIHTLAQQLFTTLTANGFTLIFPVVLTGTDAVVTLEVGSTVDPLHSPTAPLVSQPYRIRFAVGTDTIQVNLATATQLPNDGTLASFPVDTINTHTSGLVGVQQQSGSAPAQHFIDRSDYTTSVIRDSFPMSYKLAISDHGFALAIWEAGNDAAIDRLSWFVAQRSVSNTDGHVTSIDTAVKKAPVFCVYNIYRSPAIPTIATPLVTVCNKFVVRELDVSRPTESVNATQDSDDVRQSIPTSSLVSILETGSYNVSFVGGLNTQRYVYPQDELDLIAVTSADVISTGLLASFTAYGEATQRNYRALPANAGNNTRVRILMYDSHQ